jgi:hypothetical protein
MKVKALSMLKLFSLLLILIGATHAWAQSTSRLQLDSLDHLTSKASQTVVINIDERVLKLGAPFLKSTDPNEAKIKELLDGIKGIYVKSFMFENEGEFSESDVQPIRSQLNSPDWLKIVEARSRKEGENVDVFIKTDNTKIEGIVVIAFNSKELTVVNIVGSVDMDKLSRMEGQFGIPDLELERGNKENKQPQTDKKN